MATILVAEDEAPLLILAESYLGEQGHQTLSAGTLEQSRLWNLSLPKGFHLIS